MSQHTPGLPGNGDRDVALVESIAGAVYDAAHASIPSALLLHKLLTAALDIAYCRSGGRGA